MYKNSLILKYTDANSVFILVIDCFAIALIATLVNRDMRDGLDKARYEKNDVR